MERDSGAYSPKLSDLEPVLSKLLPDAGDIEPLRFVGEGFRSVAVETAGGAIIRVGKTGEAAAGFELEAKALPFIRRYIPNHVPDPRWQVAPCENLPFGALGYMKLPGENPEPGDPTLQDRFIPELAQFLLRLHSIPVEKAVNAGIPTVDPRSRLLGARPVVMPALSGRVTLEQYAHIDSWWDALAVDELMVSYDATVCHHDLWYENLLVDTNGRLSGVLDWSHVEVGDPMHDFAAVHHFGEELTERFVTEYRAAGGKLSNDDRHRIQRSWEGRDLGGLAWAIENDDELETAEAIQKVLAGPIFA